MIKISDEDFQVLQKQSATGRLVQGLIHNLNGPLQNLGMDMDMIGYSLRKGVENPSDLLEDIRKRLMRMEDEFENINRIIQNTAQRSSPDDESIYLNLGDFFEKELSLLKANLYFKHHVTTEVLLDEPLPQVGALPPGVAGGLSSLLQSFVEEMEKQELDYFRLKAAGSESSAEICISAGNGALSEKFLKAFEVSVCSDDGYRVSCEDMGIIHAVLTLNSAGITPVIKYEGDMLHLTLAL